MRYIGFVSAAERDLRRLRRSPDRAALLEALDHLSQVPLPDNLDIVPLSGRAPWHRLRVGHWRILFRRLSEEELKLAATDATEGYLIGRIIHRRDLLEAVRGL